MFLVIETKEGIVEAPKSHRAVFSSASRGRIGQATVRRLARHNMRAMLAEYGVHVVDEIDVPEGKVRTSAGFAKVDGRIVRTQSLEDTPVKGEAQ
jgi:hypothetical protein